MYVRRMKETDRVVPSNKLGPFPVSRGQGTESLNRLQVGDVSISSTFRPLINNARNVLSLSFNVEFELESIKGSCINFLL